MTTVGQPDFAQGSMYTALPQYDHTAHNQETQASEWGSDSGFEAPVGMGRPAEVGSDYGSSSFAGTGSSGTSRTGSFGV
jgi:hypothetical protein